MAKYNISTEKLLSEYMNFDRNNPLRFGQYIVNNYCDGSDSDVYYETNNGVAYKLILVRIYNQNTKGLEFTS